MLLEIESVALAVAGLTEAPPGRRRRSSRRSWRLYEARRGARGTTARMTHSADTVES
jgi:hypothetical protein